MSSGTFNKIQSVKNLVEPVHLRHLCHHFSLTTRDLHQIKGSKFDLFSKDAQAMFELKSRLFPFREPKSRGKLQYTWFSPHTRQIEGYKKSCDQLGVGAYFIFMLGYISHRLSSYNPDKIDHRMILARETFILPWDVVELSVTPNDKKQKAIGLNKILEHYEFTERHFGRMIQLNKEIPVHKNRVYIAKTIENKVGSYFI
jgi:hypothetical protein